MNETLFTAIGGFAACAVVIFFAGRQLSFYGDLLAEKTGLGKVWIGLILMAAVTSLPELLVGISSAAMIGSADLAVGDIIGSCAFNLGILSLMDAFTPKDKPLLGKASISHVLATSLGLILICMVGLGMFLPREIRLTPSIGLMSFGFAAVYFVSLRILYTYNRKNPKKEESNPDKSRLTLKQVIIQYSVYALIIIGAALFLPHFADQIATETGIGEAFVGSLFLAVSTSLPEIAVSIAAVRMGMADMAVGNLLGSNIFNVLILFISDVVYTKGLLLKDAGGEHIISIFAVGIMSAIAIIGLTYRSEGKRYLLAWDTFLIFVVYVLNMVILYNL